MSFPKHHHFRSRDRNRNRNNRGKRSERHDGPRNIHGVLNPEHTGSEARYLKSLVDSHTKVTVVLKTGERLRGHIRYYDRYCFSLGLSAQGPRLFLRKDSVSYIAEE
jgi:sRNA-binding regulator protein Hfq